MREVQLGEEVAFKEEGIPVDALAQLFGVVGDATAAAEEELQFHARAAEERPCFEGPHEVEKVGGCEDETLGRESGVSSHESGNQVPGCGEIRHTERFLAAW